MAATNPAGPPTMEGERYVRVSVVCVVCMCSKREPKVSAPAFLHPPGRVANPGRCGIPKQSEDRKVPLETYLFQGSEIQRDPAPAKASLGLLSG